uniref:non-specific serine/threonine protein kinase n=1 Tax=Knipowitschia caucasica TaxID=637954 RepID=A0AAV2JD51_KNICA
MERPSPCMDLLEYSVLHDPLPENTVRDIIKKLVQALIQFDKKWGFHRDIKTTNILIQETQEGPRYIGTVNYCPPEMFLSHECRAGPTSVWQVRAIVYELLNGDGNDFDVFEWLNGDLSLKTSEASEEAIDFIHTCLSVEPANRIRLEEIEGHPWFNTSIMAPSSSS